MRFRMVMAHVRGGFFVGFGRRRCMKANEAGEKGSAVVIRRSWDC